MLKKILRHQIFSPISMFIMRNSTLCLMLHRVSVQNNERVFPNENMKISPTFLEQFIIDALENDYKFISLDELHFRLKNNKSLSKTLVITLDDGYADNYFNAYPIFQKYKIPFAIYLNSSFINRETFPWWYKLEYLLLQNNRLLWNNNRHEIKSLANKNDLFLTIREWLLNMNISLFNNSFAELLKINNYDDSLEEDLFLTWEQINIMDGSGLLTVGNHGDKHLHLNKLDNKSVKAEIETAQQLIKQNTHIDPKHFCYPYGEIDSIVVNQLKDTFNTITTTEFGFITYKYEKYLSQLPRYFLTEHDSLNKIIHNMTISTRCASKQKIYE